MWRTSVMAAVAVVAVAGVVTTGCTAVSQETREARSGAPAASGRAGAGASPAARPATRPSAGSDPGRRDGAADAEVPTATEQEEPTLRGTDRWQVRRPARGRIEAFATRTSGTPGTRLGLKVSTSAGGYRVIAYRIGAYDGGWGRRVWRSGFLPGEVQPEPRFASAETRTVVAPWRRTLTVDTAGWRPGFYVFKLRTGTGRETLVPYVVSSPSAVGTVALVAPITTWQAYNAWGGYSLYRGPDGDREAWAVSFDRPLHLAPGANDFRSAALPIVVRAERLGVPLSYFTNVDLHDDPRALDGARGYVSMGHDEYWTPAMRRRVLRARDAGTNLAFLGANTMYWRVRLADRGSARSRLMVGYRNSAHLDPLRDEQPVQATSRFRDPPAARPENDLIGMQYECFPVDTDYRVVSPRWWGFRGTGVEYGDRIPGLVGREADRVYPDARTPRPMQVLSHTAYDCRGVGTTSQSVYYTTPSGAGVFAAGTLRWGCALVDACERPLGAGTRRFASRVVDNLLRGFAAGPVGRRHPARDNLGDFDLPLSNTVEPS